MIERQVIVTWHRPEVIAMVNETEQLIPEPRLLYVKYVQMI